MINFKYKKLAVIIGRIFMWLLLAYFIVISAVAASYSILISDDFIHGYIARTANCLNWNIIDGIKYSLHMYKTWQGTYLSMFLQYVMLPIHDLSMDGLRVVMFANSFVFFTTLILLIKVWMQNNINDNKFFFGVISSAFVYMLCSYCVYDEVFFWFSGATSYGFTMSLLFIALSFLILYKESDKKIFWFLALVIGFITMGSSLAVVGMGCYVGLLILIYYYFMGKKKRLNDAILYAVWLIGAIINTVAPGNYSRYEQTTSSNRLSPIHALIRAFKEYKLRLTWFTIHTDWIVVLGIVLLLAFFLTASFKISKMYTYVSLASLLLPAIVIFPVALGYYVDVLPLRCYFIMDVAIIGVLINLMVVIGNILRNSFITSDEMIKMFFCIYVLGLVIAANCDDFFVEQNVTIQMAKQIFDGTYSEHFNECKGFYAYLKTQEGKDVIVKAKDVPEQIPYIYNMRIEDDTQWDKFRLYYKLKSITVVEEEK